MPDPTPHEPTEKSREKVRNMAAVGVPQDDIAKVMGITSKTMRKYYRDDLDTALVNANAAIGGSLYKKAKGGDTAAIIWWEKTRAGKSDKLNIDMNQKINIVEIDSDDKGVF